MSEPHEDAWEQSPQYRQGTGHCERISYPLVSDARYGPDVANAKPRYDTPTIDVVDVTSLADLNEASENEDDGRGHQARLAT